MSTLGLCALGVGLVGCGLKGPLYLPTDPAASNRATLPSLLTPASKGAANESSAAPLPTAPAAPASAPAAGATQ